MSKLVKKAIEKHSANGLATVDYAAASWGTTVVDHSEPRFGWGIGRGLAGGVLAGMGFTKTPLRF